MCKINSGVLIKNQQDVQNLIIATLFRQEQAYHIENILDLISHYMIGSSVKMQREKLYHLISDNLDDLYIRNKVKCKNGCYIPQPISNFAANRNEVYSSFRLLQSSEN